ncbi:hypothetical protein BU23DRAFT_550143 [Bimuria novae-zelandiae CBS 107.79]|uniref:Uncharacterized protein n=1 Tax=Bimuria novae-zelandiae CBS 107.79 TaxID=1447943 RepID=A0A6A5VMC4_9PLEO|nr:hypothetical protein BU23DRAFT_550143 [Bimuria novae-zelandiae CBS 107.79]
MWRTQRIECIPIHASYETAQTTTFLLPTPSLIVPIPVPVISILYQILTISAYLTTVSTNPASTTTTTAATATLTFANVMKDSYFNETRSPWNTVANPSYRDSSNLLGSLVIFLGSPVSLNNTSVYNMSSSPTNSSTTRSYCLQQPVNISASGVYQYSVGIGRQILNGTGKPSPSTDRLQFSAWYDTRQIGGQDVCNSSNGECT